MFLIGRLLASGARLFFAAAPLCLLVFKNPAPGKTELIIAILIVGAIGVAYTVAGGIRAVIWTDTMQIIIVMGAVVLSIFILLQKIPLSLSGVIDVLKQGVPPDGA